MGYGVWYGQVWDGWYCDFLEAASQTLCYLDKSLALPPTAFNEAADIPPESNVVLAQRSRNPL